MGDAQAIIEALRLAPHPEGGWFRETWREPATNGERAHATAILFLLEGGQCSHWHRVDAAEMWIYNDGDPLLLQGAEGADGERLLPESTLGPDVTAGHAVQHLFTAGQWQAARLLGAWTLVTCVVAPGFEFSGFELAPRGWVPVALR